MRSGDDGCRSRQQFATERRAQRISRCIYAGEVALTASIKPCTTGLDFQAGLEACGGCHSPRHRGRVVRETETAIGAEENDSAVAAETVEQVGHRLARGYLWSRAGSDAIGGPLAQHQFHDGLAPPGERDGGGQIVGIATAANERRVADASRRFVECASS